jgi:hypothetical protein
VAAYRALKRRPAPAGVESPRAAEPDPAAELRARLAEARSAGDDRAEFEAGETPVDEAVALEPDARRRTVHEQARAAIDEMETENP